MFSAGQPNLHPGYHSNMHRHEHTDMHAQGRINHSFTHNIMLEWSACSTAGALLVLSQQQNQHLILNANCEKCEKKALHSAIVPLSASIAFHPTEKLSRFSNLHVLQCRSEVQQITIGANRKAFSFQYRAVKKDSPYFFYLILLNTL